MEGELAGRRREVGDKVVVCQDTPPQSRDARRDSSTRIVG